MSNKPKLELDFEGVDGNAFALLAHFRRQAKLAGWTVKEIEEVVENATSEDYDHLVSVLSRA